MRSALRCLGLASILFFLVFLPVQPAGAQVLPAGIVVDSALRIDFLFGNQVFGRELPAWEGRIPSNEETRLHENIRMDLTTRMPVIEGRLEFLSGGFVSARVAGISSFLTGDLSATLVSGLDIYTPDQSGQRKLIVNTATVTPQYHSWEIAALLHPYSYGAYRFSVLGGYRQDYWKYNVVDAGPINNTLEYRHNSRIPFFGFQTAMYFPWWKASMEVVGSPFATKFIYLRSDTQGNRLNINGTWRKGGLLEVRLEGSTYVTSSVTLGLLARYSYEELRGDVKGYGYWRREEGNSSWPYDFYTTQNLAYIGLNAGFIF